jgi:hypothetical protein
MLVFVMEVSSIKISITLPKISYWSNTAVILQIQLISMALAFIQDTKTKHF